MRPEVADVAGPLLSRHGLGERRSVVVHLSLGPAESWIGTREPDGRSTAAIGFLPLPTVGADLLAAIGAVDDNARRLLDRFADAAPAATSRLRAFDAGLDVDTPVLGWLLGATALILDLEETDLAEALRDDVAALRLDTVVLPEGGYYVVDGRRLLRSLMSYQVAGVPGPVLARSLFESLGEFAVDAVRRVLRDVPADVVACVGDLFAGNEILRRCTSRGLVGVRAAVIMPEARWSPPAEPAPTRSGGTPRP